MFQGSFFTNPEIRCLEHPRLVTHLCMETSCRQTPFMCEQCQKIPMIKQKHYGHDLYLRPLNSTLQQIAKTIKSSKKQIQNAYMSLVSSTLSSPNHNKPVNLNTTLSESNTPNLIKYQEQKQQHYHSVRKHIESIKYQLSEQVRHLTDKFKQALENQLQNMHKQLQRYYNSYKQCFEAFSQKIAPIVLISKQLKYYSQPESIMLKLMNETNFEQRNKWFLELKKSAAAAERIASDYENQIQKLKKISVKTNQLMDKLPRMRGPDYQNQIRKVMAHFVQEIFHCVVKFGENDYGNGNHKSMGDVFGNNKSMSSMHRTYSMQPAQTSHHSSHRGIFDIERQRY